MSKNKKLKTCLQKGNNKTSTDEGPVSKTMKLDPEYASPKRSCNTIISGHSTPINKEKNPGNVEDSPELNYRYSPIFLPLTQEGGNEVAWEWHTPVKKSSEEKVKGRCNQVETPKRTRQLQKKRNSNSPLHMHLKTKQVKMADRENIGKFTAELKALNDKIGSIQQNHNNDRDNEFDIRDELDQKLMIKSDTESMEDIMAEDPIDDELEEKVDPIHTINNNNIEKDVKYQDLFDDSIEDSMVKCSQEVEEKFNLLKDVKPKPMVSPKASELKKSSIHENRYRHSTSFNSLTESSRGSTSQVSVPNISSDLRTYSNTSHRSGSSWKFSSDSTSMLDTKQILADCKSKSKSSDFPDDSFDDCLATCMAREESKSSSRLAEYDFCPLIPSEEENINQKQYSPSKQNKSNRLSSRQVTNKTPSSTLENRKFFQTRSLSDQCFNQSRKNLSASTVKTVEGSVIKSSVSTTYPRASDRNPYKNDNVPATEGTKTTEMSGEKRLSGHFVKYKSTSNLPSAKEVKDSNCMKCTPEEIERKRLEAKMRLEAKRKSQKMGVTNNSSGATVKR